MTHSLLPPALALVLISSGAAAVLVREEPLQVLPSLHQLTTGVQPPTGDERPGSELTLGELKQRLSAARAATRSKDILPAQRAKLRAQIAADADELRWRNAVNKTPVVWIQEPAAGEQPPANSTGLHFAKPTLSIADNKRFRVVEFRRHGAALRARPAVSRVLEHRPRNSGSKAVLAYRPDLSIEHR